MLPKLLRIAAILLATAHASAASASEGSPRSIGDIVYATVNGKALGLDLHLPASVREPPLVVYVHGGAWNAGNKSQYPAFLVEQGFAVASLDFRSTDEARFPANVHDIKAAVRFLRAKAGGYGYRPERIALVGVSSGGHLAALVAVTGGHRALEGTVGAHPGESSRVQAVVSWYGASDLTTILSQSTPRGLAVRVPALQRLFGTSPEAAPDLVKLASPVFHVDAQDPPLFVLHGDQDGQMPVNQALELDWAYRNAGLNPQLMILHGVDHVAEPFFTGEPAERVVRFLKETIGG